MDDRKTTIMLTIIAVATLIVALVGATFAYFSATGNDKATTDVKVKTGTAASTSFEINGGLEIVANINNFASGKPSLVAATTGTATWTAPGAFDTYTPSDSDRTMCYTVALSITGNNFVVNPDTDVTSKPAEIMFNVSKKAYNVTEDVYTEVTSGITDIEYKTVTGRATSLENGETTAKLVSITGWDITTLGANASLDSPVTIYVPGNNGNKHVMIADAGKAVTDNWKASITLVNLDAKQNYNTDKEFNANLIFAKTDC